MTPVDVAFDVGPLSGRRTGIGVAVAELRQNLEARSDVTLTPYLTSFRAARSPGQVRVPMPAMVAQRCWERAEHPRIDRRVRPARVIHGTNYVVPPSRLPRLVSVYDCWFLRHPESALPDVVRAGRILMRSLARGATAHASSHATADALRDIAPYAEVSVVHLGAIALPAATAECPIPELGSRPFVLATGTIERRKNLPRLVDAFGRASSDVDGLSLVIAGGDGDDRHRVDQAIDRLPRRLADRVLLTGYVPDDARSWLLRNAAVLAYPSLDEGFGFPLLDAMQAQVPIVASRAGSIPEVAGEAAELCDASDTDELAACLVRAVVDDERRTRMLHAGKRQLEIFTWARTTEGIVDLYRRLADRSPSRAR
jgi:glycosyltransferase involved in cell wall biosynthesis